MHDVHLIVNPGCLYGAVWEKVRALREAREDDWSRKGMCVCVFLIGVKRGSLGGTPAWGKTLHVWNVFEGFNA